MKTFFSLLFCTCLLAAKGQVQTIHTTINPTSNGFVVELPIDYKIAVCAGEVHIEIGYSSKDATSSTYKYKGKSYSPQDLGMPAFTNVSLGMVDITADVYSGSARIGTVTLGNVISWGVSKSGGLINCVMGQTYHLSPQLGVRDEDYRSKVGQMSIQIRNIKGAGSSYEIESKIAQIENDQKFDVLKQEADNLFGQKRYPDALKKYQEAQKLKYDDEHCRQRIEECKRLMKEEETNKKVEEHIKAGDKLMGSGDLEGAKREYNRALSIDPDNQQAKDKLAQVGEAEEKKKVEEEKLKEEEKNKKEGEEAKKKEEDEEEKRREEEARREEEERRRREEEERQRLERQKKYYEEQDKIRQENQQRASEMGTSALLLHYYLGTIIYANIGEDSYRNLFKDDNYKLGFKAGYGFTSMPMFFNSSYESYDGNQYTYDEEVTNQQTGTLDLMGGIEFWPLYGKQAGIGAFAGAGFGHGILFQQFTLFAQGGLRSYAGFEHVKLFAEYSYGVRSVKVNSWIDPQEYGSGKTSYNYMKLKIGPRFCFDADFMGKTKATLDILPSFEKPSFLETKYMTPLNIRWMNGLSIDLSFDNRLLFFGEFFWNYKRSGETEYAFSKSATYSGTFIRMGVLRNFDAFGESPLNMDKKKVQTFTEKQAFNSLIFFNPGLSWNHDKHRRTSAAEPTPGIALLYEMDKPLLPNTNFTMGFGASYSTGGKNTFNTTGMSSSVTYSSLLLGTSLRSYLIPDAPQKYWVKYGLNHHFALLRTDKEAAMNAASRFNLYIPCLVTSAGLDYKTGPDGQFRCGVQFERSLKPYYITDQASYFSNRLSLLVGVLF